MRIKRLMILGALAVVITVVTACTSAGQYNNDLQALLPTKQGLTWRYFGFAEYDHVMTLDSITQISGGTRYDITGEVGDPSGGEATRDLNLAITYTIKNGVWLQEKQEEAMMDSEFDKLEILRGPVKQGATWTQKQKDKNGTDKTLECTIQEVKTVDGVRTVVVKYKDQASDYYELRGIKQGVGITMFEKLWMSSEGNFEIGYSLFLTE